MKEKRKCSNRKGIERKKAVGINEMQKMANLEK